MAERKLVVRMFGGFTAHYGNELLTFGRQRNSKFEQLFQILLTRPGQGFDKRDIAESLYEREEVENLNASLNNTIFRLRKYLKASPLPPGDYLDLNDGTLRFTGNVRMDSDVWHFECAAKAFDEAQDKRKKAKACEKACGLYQGEFLPRLSNEQWVIERNSYYRKLYSGMMKYLLGYLKEEGDYENMEKVASNAARFCPDEGWELWQVDGLISMGCYKEAEQVYQKMAVRMQKNGGFLTEKQQACFRDVGARIWRPEGDRKDIDRYLAEPVPPEGAYACMLPGFSDCFHMLKRIMARGEVKGFSLLLCTILDPKGRPARDREYCEKQGEKLLMSFKNCLRKGDVYAKYSDGQYLVLCAGAGRENALEIGARIDMDFRKRCAGRGGISCGFLDDGTAW